MFRSKAGRASVLLSTTLLVFCPLVLAPRALAQDAAGDEGGVDVSISGSVRPRYETLTNPLVEGASGTEDLFALRTALEIEASLGDFSATVEGLDARRLLGDDNPDGGPPSQLNAAEILQARLAWKPEDLILAGDRLEIAAGRFTIDVGARRLVARSGFSSVPTAFDGVDARWIGPTGLTLRGFTVQPVSKRPSDDISLLDNEIAMDSRLDNVRLSVLWGSTPLPGGLTAELGVYLLDEDDSSEIRTRNRHLDTWSGRLLRKHEKGRLDFDIEGALQTGEVRASTSAADQTDLSHDAFMLHAEAGYTLPSDIARVSLHYDRASGDEDPADGENNRFDTLFGDRSFELGPTSIFGAVARTNLDSAAIRLDYTPPGPWDGMLSLRTVRLESATDSLGGSGLRDATGNSGSHAGEQIEWRVRRWLVEDAVRLAVGGALFLRGDFVDNAAGGPTGDPVYTYADVTWTF